MKTSANHVRNANSEHFTAGVVARAHQAQGAAFGHVKLAVNQPFENREARRGVFLSRARTDETKHTRAAYWIGHEAHNQHRK